MEASEEQRGCQLNTARAPLVWGWVSAGQEESVL